MSKAASETTKWQTVGSTACQSSCAVNATLSSTHHLNDIREHSVSRWMLQKPEVEQGKTSIGFLRSSHKEAYLQLVVSITGAVAAAIYIVAFPSIALFLYDTLIIALISCTGQNILL